MSAAPLKLASTVLVVTPGAEYRVLMVKRSAKARFFPSAHVFPGGVAEPCDGADPAAPRARRLTAVRPGNRRPQWF